MQEQIISQAAEAIIIKQGSNIIKRRIKKSYRIPEIDEKLRKLRTRSEAKIMEKLQGKINVPKIIKVDEKNKEILMQYIQGKKLSDFLDSFPISKQLSICREIGKEVAKMHDLNIIHSDLTTSNMILVENNTKTNKSINNKQKPAPELSNSDSVINNNSNFKIFFIDFGLSFHSLRIEDKAVDLHLLRQALESKHYQHWEKLFKAIIESYKSKDKEKILKQLEKVEKRGRYK